MTLVEELRIYPKIEHAIFYDGVNEFGRSREDGGGKNYNNNPNTYKLIGAPYRHVERLAIKSQTIGINLLDTNLGYIIKRITHLFKVGKLNSNIEGLDDIVDRYFQNIKVIKVFVTVMA